MDTKLTLRLNQEVLEQAEQYAKTQNVSLSKLVETLLSQLPRENEDVSPLVKSLSGVITLPDDYDHKSDYADYVNKKYQ